MIFVLKSRTDLCGFFILKKQYSPFQLAWSRFLRIRSAVIALGFILIWLFLAVFSAWIVPDKSENANTQLPELSGLKPLTSVVFLMDEKEGVPIEKSGRGWVEFGSDIPVAKTVIESELDKRTYLLGNDRFGRDVLSRLVLGSRYSLAVGFVSVVISLIVGCLIGALAGYYRGWVDTCLSWFTTVIWSVPLMLLVIAITMALGKGLLPLFLAIGLATWVDVARVVRGQVLSLREKEYIEACRSFGYSDLRIIFIHILPNLSGILLVLASSNFASAILLESGLNFLGLGAQPPIPTWGNMIRDHIGYLFAGNGMALFAPSICVFLIVLAFSTVGNALRDAMDVKYLEKS